MNVVGLINSAQKIFIHYAKRFYVIFWHELSRDKRVKASPYVPAPENEVKMTTKKKVYVRIHRIWILLQHILAIIGLYFSLSRRVYTQTTIFGIILIIVSDIGIVCGAHRLWAHRSFKAEWPLKVFLMLCQSMTSQYSVLYWVRIHRVHHKFSDTPRDPHNVNVGFFFSHIGWILIQRSPEVTEELKKIYVEDLEKDKLVMFQHRYYIPLTILICYIIPAIIPWYFWNEDILMAICVPVSLRFVIVLHLTSSINSIAHAQGKKPFDKNILPADSRLAWFLTLGDEGWHNYHHVFPWDYKASDYWGYTGGVGSMCIEFFARMGWAYDLKTTSAEVTTKRRSRTGDLSCYVWGWNDANMDSSDRALAQISYQKQPKNEHNANIVKSVNFDEDCKFWNTANSLN